MRTMPGLGVASFLLVSALASALGVARAQDLEATITDRGVRAAVRVQVDVAGGSSAGSGAFVDPRGYVLTNLHVVGFVRHGERGGVPGTFFGDGQHVQIATVDSDRDTARTQCIGRVVRADVRLDLALVRVVARADGTPVPAGTVFPYVELGPTTALHPGVSLWCFGFPLGVRTINVTGGHMTGFQMNTRGEVSWIRTDAEFNPGNSGGMLLDRAGRLVAVPTAVWSGRETLEPIEVARPTERIPREWLEALGRADVADVRVTGILQLQAGVELSDESVGDGGALEAPDVLYYALPVERPGLVQITPALPLGLFAPNGRAVREGRGRLAIGPMDPEGSIVAVVSPRTADAATVALRLSYAAEPRPTPSQAGAADRVRVRGRMIDRRTGRGVPGLIVVGAPGLDLAHHVALFLGGRISDAQFQSGLVASARTDAAGAYLLEGVPRGSFAGAALGVGYPPSMITLTVRPEEGPVVDVNPIVLGR